MTFPRFLLISLALLGALAALLALGNPQWNRWVYVAQEHYFDFGVNVPDLYDGAWREWDEGGVLLIETTYVNGRQNGPAREWQYGPSGSYLAQFHEHVKDEPKVGIRYRGRSIQYHDNGRIRELSLWAGNGSEPLYEKVFDRTGSLTSITGVTLDSVDMRISFRNKYSRSGLTEAEVIHKDLRSGSNVYQRRDWLDNTGKLRNYEWTDSDCRAGDVHHETCNDGTVMSYRKNTYQGHQIDEVTISRGGRPVLRRGEYGGSMGYEVYYEIDLLEDRHVMKCDLNEQGIVRTTYYKEDGSVKKVEVNPRNSTLTERVGDKEIMTTLFPDGNVRVRKTVVGGIVVGKLELDVQGNVLSRIELFRNEPTEWSFDGGELESIIQWKRDGTKIVIFDMYDEIDRRQEFGLK